MAQSNYFIPFQEKDIGALADFGLRKEGQRDVGKEQNN